MIDAAAVVQAALLAVAGGAFGMAARQLIRIEERLRDAELDIAKCCGQRRRAARKKAL